jgi:hypothetical protein
LYKKTKMFVLTIGELLLQKGIKLKCIEGDYAGGK